MSEKRVKAWHFTGDKLRDGSPIPKVGEWLEYPGKIVICNSGLHASRDPFNALLYAPGPILHLVECEGIVTEQHDKLVCARRRIIASKDATEGLRYFARMQALSVAHLWDAPDICIEWLMTGDENIRFAAWSAANSAANSVANSASHRCAANSAAWSAANSTANSVVNNAVWSESWSAARRQFNELVREAFEGYL